MSAEMRVRGGPAAVWSVGGQSARISWANAHGKRVSDTPQETRIVFLCERIFRKELATNGTGRISAEVFGEVNPCLAFLIWRIEIWGRKGRSSTRFGSRM
jgi:hypothetical protein